MILVFIIAVPASEIYIRRSSKKIGRREHMTSGRRVENEERFVVGDAVEGNQVSLYRIQA